MPDLTLSSSLALLRVVEKGIETVAKFPLSILWRGVRGEVREELEVR